MSPLKRIAPPLIYLALYQLADLASVGHDTSGLFTTPWNAAPALSIALILRYGWSWLPYVLISPLLAGLIEPDPQAAFWQMLIRAIAESLGGVICLLMLKGRSPDLLQLRGVLRLLLAAGCAAALIAGTRSLEILLTVSPPFWQGLAMSGELWLAHLVAILSIVPAALLLDRSMLRHWRLDLTATGEAILQAGALLLIAWEVFGRFVNAEIHFFYLLFLPFAWIAARHGQKGVALALGALYLAPVATDILFGHKDMMIVELQIRLGVLAVTSLLFGALVAERRQAAIRMQERQTELAHFQRLNVGWEMASALAHELNQPLTAAMNLTQAALRLLKAPNPDLERTAEVMGKSVDRIERVGQIIHGLRDFMRKGELTLSKIMPASIVEDALRLVSAEASAAGVTMAASGLTQLPPVMADRTQVVQVLVNLLRNAIQALASAKSANPQISVFGKTVEDMIEIAVADNGPGLAPEVMDRLFEPFVTTKASGMGLGLSISKSILEAHEGRLWAENAPSGGAIFRLTLPLAGRSADNA